MHVDEDFRYPESEGVISIPLFIILSIVTCGIWWFVWQYKQMKILNAWQETDEHNFGLWLLLTFITCGIYSLYYEYKMSKAINDIQEVHGIKVNSDLALICVLLSIFTTPLVSTAIQQGEINKFYN